jgi:hypothetical protein
MLCMQCTHVAQLQMLMSHNLHTHSVHSAHKQGTLKYITKHTQFQVYMVLFKQVTQACQYIAHIMYTLQNCKCQGVVICAHITYIMHTTQNQGASRCSTPQNTHN